MKLQYCRMYLLAYMYVVVIKQREETEGEPEEDEQCHDVQA